MIQSKQKDFSAKEENYLDLHAKLGDSYSCCCFRYHLASMVVCHIFCQPSSPSVKLS